VKETVDTVRRCGAKSSIIPLFNTPEAVYRLLDYYGPDIIHFCEMLPPGEEGRAERECLIVLQHGLRERYPGVVIMRSVPIPVTGSGHGYPVVAIAREFEPVSDFFLTDTLITAGDAAAHDDQPVAGFVGITGKTCDWDDAAALVRESRVPVILAGGLSPENVAAGIAKVRPAGVDTCTATNAVDAVGRPVRFMKDPEKVRRFVEAARRAG
jgi:phosphoribosylanthranilate isomerase